MITEEERTFIEQMRERATKSYPTSRRCVRRLRHILSERFGIRVGWKGALGLVHRIDWAVAQEVTKKLRR